MFTKTNSPAHLSKMCELFERVRRASEYGPVSRLQCLHLLLDAIRIGREGCDANIVLRELHPVLPKVLGVPCQETSCAPELILGTIDLMIEETLEAEMKTSPQGEEMDSQLTVEQLRVLRRLTPGLHLHD